MNKIKERDGIQRFKPVTNGLRSRSVLKSPEITYDGEPKKVLTKYINRSYGINNQGKRTCRGMQKGTFHKYRFIDWKRDKENIPAEVMRIEKDPNRSANIALLKYDDGVYRYILCPKDLQVGSKIIRSDEAVLEIGNCLKLGVIPVGNLIHAIELNPKEGAKLARSAGSFATVLSHEDERTKIKLSSGEIRTLSSVCIATLGAVGNIFWNKTNIGSAGHNRHLGRKPIVRGSVMNPRDHPHGGGEGKQPLGRHPVNKNGKPMFGKKRSKSKFTNRFIDFKSREK